MNKTYTKIVEVRHSLTKSSWNIYGVIFGGKFKYDRFQYTLCIDDEKGNSKRRTTAYELAKKRADEVNLDYMKETSRDLLETGKTAFDVGRKYGMCMELEIHGVNQDKALEYVKVITMQSNNIDFCVETVKRIVAISRYNCITIETLMELSFPLPLDNLYMLWDVLFAVGAMGNVGINNINVLGLFVNSYYRNQRRYAKEIVSEKKLGYKINKLTPE